jgi:hypothetical protein
MGGKNSTEIKRYCPSNKKPRISEGFRDRGKIRGLFIGKKQGMIKSFLIFFVRGTQRFIFLVSVYASPHPQVSMDPS